MGGGNWRCEQQQAPEWRGSLLQQQQGKQAGIEKLGGTTFQSPEGNSDRNVRRPGGTGEGDQLHSEGASGWEVACPIQMTGQGVMGTQTLSTPGPIQLLTTQYALALQAQALWLQERDRERQGMGGSDQLIHLNLQAGQD